MPTPTPRSKENVCTRCGISGKGPPLGRFHCAVSETICYKCKKREQECVEAWRMRLRVDILWKIMLFM